MTSRQPGAESPGSALRRGASWSLVPLVLLILLGLVGLSGVLTPPGWDGPWQRDRLVIGLGLEVVLVVLFVITNNRRRAATRLTRLRALGQGKAPADVAATEMAAKLRAVLLFVLGGGIAAVAGVMLTNLKLPAGHRAKLPPPPRFPKGKRDLRGHWRHTIRHLPLTALLYGLLVTLLIAAVLLSIWWARRQRASGTAKPDSFIAADPEDPQSLREAVESGRTALRTFDDARAAIIACYVAMEASLAQRGAARGVAGTPDELLARATRQGVVRGTAAGRLTALFYEARFSSHPLDPGQRDTAEQALDELAATLAAGNAPGVKVGA